MKRRGFIKSAIFGGVSGIIGIAAKPVLSKEMELYSNQDNDLVAVIGGEPKEMFNKAIEEMGGMTKFIKKGSKVVVKPNIGWDKRPEFAANTNPDLIEAIVSSCLKAGASEVTVFDNTCDEWQACYKNSGIEDAVKKAGGKMAFAHDERYYKSVSLPSAKRLKETKIHEAILNCDVWINVPVLKNHGGARMTIAMKNYMGIIWDRRYLHGNDLQQCIADCSTYEKKPVLNIVDAYRIMTRNGPKGKTVEDVQLSKALFISTDIVAVDTAAVRFFNQFVKVPLEDVSHITIAEQMNLGTTNLDSLKVKRVRI